MTDSRSTETTEWQVSRLAERIEKLEQHLAGQRADRSLRADAMAALVGRVVALEAKPTCYVTLGAFASLANRVVKLEESVAILGADIGKLAVDAEVESTRSRTATAPQTSGQEPRATIVRWLRHMGQHWGKNARTSSVLRYGSDALLDTADAIENGEPERWAAEERKK